MKLEFYQFKHNEHIQIMRSLQKDKKRQSNKNNDKKEQSWNEQKNEKNRRLDELLRKQNNATPPVRKK